MRFRQRVNLQWPVLLLMFVVGSGVYWNALWNPFQYDDGSVVVSNPYIRNIRNIPLFFSDLKLSQLIDDAGAVIHYRPLWTATYAINYAISGLNPFGYHLVNLGFHVGSAFLLFLILQVMLTLPILTLPLTLPLPLTPSHQGRGERWVVSHQSGVGEKKLLLSTVYCLLSTVYFIPLSVALLFLVHPFNSEVVNYITARSSVMCAFFYLLAFYLWVRFRTPFKSPPPFPPHPHPIPPPSRGRELKGGGRVRVGFYIASLIAFLVAMLTKEIAITLPVILFLYDLYTHKNTPPLTLPLEGGGLGGNRKWWPLKWKSYIPYLPFIFLLSIPLTMIYLSEVRLKLEQGFKFERGYLPHLYTQAGVIIEYLKLFVLPSDLSIDHYFKVQQTFFTPGVFIPVIFLVLYIGIALSIPRVLKREYMWVSFFMLFFLITILPTSVTPLNILMQENRAYLPFAGITAAGGVLLKGVYSVLSTEDRKRWRLLIALSLVLLFIVYSAGTINRNKVWQDRFTLWADAVQKSPDSPRAHANLAYAYIRRGDNDMAMKEFVEALRLNPKDAGLHNDVATFYYGQNDLERAEHHLKASISIRPDYYLAYNNLGLLYERLGRPEEAIPLYQRALRLRPEFTTAQARLKRALMTTRGSESNAP